MFNGVSVMHHEPIATTEKFVGNTQEGDARIAWLHARGVTSARLGIVAYDIDGKKLPGWCLPVIIARADEMKYDAAMTTGLRPNTKA